MEGPFSFETLSKQEAIERKSPRLTAIGAQFFVELRKYLELLEVSHRKEQERSPTGKRAQLLADEFRNARRKAETLWESRERKIVQFALKNARGDPASSALPENLTKEEQPFYEVLLRACRDQQQRVLPSVIGQPEPPPLPRPVVQATTQGSSSVVRTEPTPGSAPPAAVDSAPPAPQASGDELQTIRALVDIPPFVGFDGRTYRIKKGEVLSLPKRFVKILKDRGQVALVA